MNNQDAEITICTVNYNSASFIDLMLFAFEKLTRRKYKVIIRDNCSAKKDFDKLKKIVANYENVSLYRVETDLKGSEAHGTALNDLVGKIDTPYGVVIDADATFLYKDWDDLLINKMSEEKPIVGTQADTLGGKPMDFPLMFAIIFKTEIIKRLNIDFRPKDISNFQDTGWELREKYQAAGYKGGLIYDYNTRLHKDTPFKELICSCYYENSDKGNKGSLIASHFGRGSAPYTKNLIKFGKDRSKFIVKLINKFLMVFNFIKWKRDKKKWIMICRQIIKK